MSENSLTTIQFSTEHRYKELSKLNVNKSCGPDKLHPRVLKELSPVLCDALKIMFENSMSTGLLPSYWKTSNISVP